MSQHTRRQPRTQLKPVAQAASLALVAMAGLVTTPQALAGSGYADIVLQGGGAGRIGTYFAYSPSGERVTPIPEAVGLPNPSGMPNYTGKALRKFIDPLPLPGAGNAKLMADGTTQKYIPVAVGSPWTNPKGEVTTDVYYEIALVEYTDRFHTDLRKETTLRGYVQIDHLASNNRGALAGSLRFPLTYPDGQPILINGTDANGKMTGNKVQALAVDKPRFLGPVIAATKGIPTRMKFLNLLPTGRAELGGLDANGKPIVTRRNGDIFFPVDKTILGAGVGPDGITEYTQNRADIHLHGGDTPWISDGTPHQWITPIDEADPANPRSLAAEFGNVANNLDPALLPHYLRGVSAANAPDMHDPGPGAVTYYWPNGQTARFLWYHDHTFGATRTNVYAGMASGYLLTDPTETALVNSGALPPGSRTIPLVMQDRTFVPDDIALQDARWNTGAWGAPGDSWFPHVYETVQDPEQENNWNAVGRWHYGPWFWPVYPSLYALPTGEYSVLGAENTVTTTPEAWMDTPIVNGVAYPTMEVDPTTYRFRILNATNDRMLTFNLFEAKSTATLADGTLVTATQPTGPNSDGPVAEVPTEIDMVPASVPAFPCAPDVTRPQPTPGAPGGVCTPTTWPSDNRLGGVPDPKGVGPSVYFFASEGGWLPKVVKMDPTPLNYLQDKGRITVLNPDTKGLFLAPAERADVVIDFSQYAGKTLLVYNDSGAPVPAGDPRNDLFTGVGDQTGSGGTEDTKPGYGPNIRTFMQIKVKPLPDGTQAPAPYNPAQLEAEVTAAYYANQERPTVAQPDYAGFDPAWANLTPDQSYAGIYVGSLKDPVYKFVPGVPQPGMNSVQVTAAGGGYLTAPIVTIAAPAVPVPGAKTATALATMKISSISVQAAGSGYTSAPLVTVVGGGGNGATATATLTVNTVTVTSGGSYTSPTGPTAVNFSAPPTGPGNAKPANVSWTTELIAGSNPARYAVKTVTIGTPGTGYSASPLISFTGTGTAARATSSGGVGAVKVTNPDPNDVNTAGGGGYTDLTQTIINFTGGGGTGASAAATGKVFDITLTHPGYGYAAGELPSISIDAPPAGPLAQQAHAAAVGTVAGYAQASHLIKSKTIQELFDPTYGRLNATFGVELPFTSAATQTTIPLNYVDPLTEQFADGETQIWKITHNGVDTHPIHFHLLNVQLINRVGWDGYITPPLPQELGWKETIKMNPLEDVIVAVRANKPTLPFGLPLSVRPMDPTQPLGSPFGFTQIDPTTGFPATVVNDLANYGWEYVRHCHILGHEENDFMRAVRFDANEGAPTAPVLVTATGSASGVALGWTDTSATEYKFEVQRADVLADNSVGPFEAIGSALANFGQFADATATGMTNASGGTSLAYKVVAVGGNGSAESNVLNVSLVGGSPSAPTGLTATAVSDTTVQLDWADTSLNEAGFLVERSLNGGATWTPLTAATPVAPGSPFTTNFPANATPAAHTSDATLSTNTTVYYRVSAANVDGQSAYATASAITLGAPAIGSLVATPNSATQVTVNWSPVAPAANQTVTSYTLVRTGGGLPTLSTSLAANVTSFVDNNAGAGLAPNTAYTYTVNAVNNTGGTPVAGVPSSTTTTTQYLPAGALLTLTASADSSTQVTVNWTGGVPSTSTLIERCTWALANGNCSLPTSVWSVVNKVDTTVIANTSYSYRATALNGPVNVSNTLTASVTTPGGVFVSPPINLVSVTNFPLLRIDLTWTDTAINETAFIVERSSDGVNFAQVGIATPRNGSPTVEGTPGQTRTFSDSTVVLGATYQYRVRAQNTTAGVVSDSNPSNLISVEYFLGGATNLAGVIGSATRINLSWIDNSAGETGFEVWAARPNAAAIRVGTVQRQGTASSGKGTTVTYQHNSGGTFGSFIAGETYTYYVVATNGTVRSANSVTASVPFVAPAVPTHLAATVAGTTVTLTWDAMPGATGYAVSRRSLPNGAWTQLTTNTTAVTRTDTGRTRGTTYEYEVRSNGPAGNSAWAFVQILVP
jgi:FtsP/CotA-like multicopper oxidase with cupredoxin domain